MTLVLIASSSAASLVRPSSPSIVYLSGLIEAALTKDIKPSGF